VRVYVIGKYEEKEVIRSAMELLIKAGHAITCDWTVGPDASTFSGTERLATLAQAAIEDARGAALADAVIVFHHEKLCGGLVEFGIALGNPGTHLCVIARPDPVARRQPIFYWHPRVKFFQEIEAVVYYLSQCEKKGWE
jgi:hypothetical protein